MTLHIKKYEEMLKSELLLVETELKSVGRRNPSNPEDWEATPPPSDTLASDENEVADKIEEYEENAGILKQLEIRYNEIKKALDRIQNGTYGRCEICDREIEDERLEANPGATTCIKHLA